jgi:hypothetical protein
MKKPVMSGFFVALSQPLATPHLMMVGAPIDLLAGLPWIAPPGRYRKLLPIRYATM